MFVVMCKPAKPSSKGQTGDGFGWKPSKCPDRVNAQKHNQCPFVNKCEQALSKRHACTPTHTLTHPSTYLQLEDEGYQLQTGGTAAVHSY